MAIKFLSQRIDEPNRQELDTIAEWRSHRFRILVCIDGSDESYECLRFAAEIGGTDDCDIILCHVRPIDQGLRTGGLQVRVARENMLDWGLELPGVRYLKKGLDILIHEEGMLSDWDATTTTRAVWGDPLGDTKTEYRHESGKSIVLKLKVAPDAASGILDQYELGPYNLMIMGRPSRWQGELSSFVNAGVVQKVAMLSPCSVMIARPHQGKKGHLICTDGADHSMEAVRRDAVLAKHCGQPITLMSVALDVEEKPLAEEAVYMAKHMLEQMKIDVDETIVGVGRPVETILEASADHNLIVVSDSGKGRLKRFFTGSVAFGVMGGSETSVLNVR